MNRTIISAQPGLPFIEIEREFDAPRELVYRAHIDPALLAEWLGPRRLTMVVERWDPVDGGAWRFVQREADGTEYGFHGVFHGTPSFDGLTQTFEFDGAPGHVSLDALTFDERAGRTTVRIHSVHQSVEARDAMIDGGMATGVDEGYSRLDEVLARLRTPVA
jgi:uncharacterized protein YndB with AHSA1/START domain